MIGYEGLIPFVRTHSDFKQSSPALINDWKEYIDTLKKKHNKAINYGAPKQMTFHDFDYLHVIGRGSFSKVLLAFHKTTKEYFAIKILDITIKDGRLRHIINEKNTLMAIHFQFIVEMRGYFENKQNIFFVLQLVPGGDLTFFFKKHGFFDERLSKFYAAQVLLALEYLHHIDIVHRDLKPENILMDIRGYVKLTDLGLCKQLKKDRTYTFCGTPEYMAPEIILNKGHGKSVDYWSFGVLLFELNSGYTPFFGKSNLHIFAKIINGDYEMERYFSEDLKHLTDNLLQRDISKRFGVLKDGIDDIKNHKWFSDIKWLDLANKEISAPYVPRIEEIEARLKRKCGTTLLDARTVIHQ